jgi:hypothetical protein
LNSRFSIQGRATSSRRSFSWSSSSDNFCNRAVCSWSLNAQRLLSMSMWLRANLSCSCAPPSTRHSAIYRDRSSRLRGPFDKDVPSIRSEPQREYASRLCHLREAPTRPVSQVDTRHGKACRSNLLDRQIRRLEHMCGRPRLLWSHAHSAGKSPL